MIDNQQPVKMGAIPTTRLLAIELQYGAPAAAKRQEDIVTVYLKRRPRTSDLKFSATHAVKISFARWLQNARWI